MVDYLKIVYDENTRPYTAYPEKLMHYLFNSFQAIAPLMAQVFGVLFSLGCYSVKNGLIPPY